MQLAEAFLSDNQSNSTNLQSNSTNLQSDSTNFESNGEPTYDAIIVGGGPIGLACAIACKEKRLTYLVLEKGSLVNSLFNYPLNMTFFSTADKLEIGGVPFVSTNVKATRPEALEYYRRVCLSHNLKLHLNETVEEITCVNGHYNVQTNGANYFSSAVVIATGFYDLPNRLGVPGEDLDKVSHYFKESHPFFDKDLLVIGAANSAVDVALESYRKGARVTMALRGTEFGDNVKYWVKPDIENRIKEGSITAFFRSTVVEITPNTVFLRVNGKLIDLKNDYVLAMTGYLPNFSFLEKIGITFRSDEYKTPIYNEDTMESEQKGVYLAGVVCGGYNTKKWFIENSRVQAPLIASSIKTKKELA